jgi:hypothetical protein
MKLDFELPNNTCLYSLNVLLHYFVLLLEVKSVGEIIRFCPLAFSLS